jgi:hypothetical protein
MRTGVFATIFLGLMGMAAVPAQAQSPQPSMSTGQTESSGLMGHTGGMGEMDKPAPPASPLKITFGDKSATWTPATLAALPHTTVTVYNEHTKAKETYSGVPVMELLTRIGVPAKPHGKDFRLYLVCVGSDGYEAVFAMGEIAPYIHDAPTIVADSEDGKALTSEGPLKLISTGDKMPERWVRNLVAIRVLAAD